MSEDEDINKTTKFVQDYRDKEQKFIDYLFSMKENDIPIQAIEKVLNELNSKKGTINALKIALKERTDERDKKDEIINKKDRIINAMALQLSGISIWDNQKEEPIILASEDAVKKYYERKVKDE